MMPCFLLMQKMLLIRSTEKDYCTTFNIFVPIWQRTLETVIGDLLDSLSQGGAELKSSEGTTQGDPLAMATYGIGILPLLAAAQKDDH